MNGETNPEEQTHPLERMLAWVGQKDEGEMSVVEFFGDGPAHLDVTEIEFREWVSEGVALQRLGLCGLASAVGVLPSTDRDQPLPQSPKQRFGY